MDYLIVLFYTLPPPHAFSTHSRSFRCSCRKMLPTQDLALCDVPPPASSYTLTDAERSKLRVQAVLGPG